MRWHWLRARYEHCSTGIVGHRHGVGHGYRHGHCRTLQVLQHWLLWPASNFFALEWAPAASWIFSPPRFVCQPRFHCLVIIIVVMLMIKTALAQIPISTFSHIWVFVCQYGIMFVIIVIIIIIIIIYRKVKVSTLKHV